MKYKYIYFPCDDNRGRLVKYGDKHYIRIEDFYEGEWYHYDERIEVKHAKPNCKKCMVSLMQEAKISDDTIKKVLNVSKEFVDKYSGKTEYQCKGYKLRCPSRRFVVKFLLGKDKRKRKTTPMTIFVVE